MSGKCGGGRKNLGVSYNFPTERAFLEHVRKICMGCQECGAVDLKENMIRTSTEYYYISHYLCSDCFQE